MLEIKAQEVEGTCARHPRNFRMTVFSLVCRAGGTFIYSLPVPYLTSIFDMLKRGNGVPAGTSVAPFSFVLRFANGKTAMPVTRLQAAVQP